MFPDTKKSVPVRVSVLPLAIRRRVLVEFDSVPIPVGFPGTDPPRWCPPILTHLGGFSPAFKAARVAVLGKEVVVACI
jgi:hypothetical protein